jgi:hypothetical protein
VTASTFFSTTWLCSRYLRSRWRRDIDKSLTLARRPSASGSLSSKTSRRNAFTAMVPMTRGISNATHEAGVPAVSGGFIRADDGDERGGNVRAHDGTTRRRRWVGQGCGCRDPGLLKVAAWWSEGPARHNPGPKPSRKRGISHRPRLSWGCRLTFDSSN